MSVLRPWLKGVFRVLSRCFRPRGIFYIGNNGVLPPPLSAEEEKDCLLRRSKGDTKAETMLIERNLRLVVYIAKRFENTGVDIEDLISIGTIGLIKAVKTFNIEKKIKLATYASRCIENEILMFLRRNNKKKGEVSFEEPLNIDWDGNELCLSDICGTEGDLVFKGIEEEVDRELLIEAMEQLSKRERHILIMRFGLGNWGKVKTQKEVADLLGISQSYISRLEKKILRKLKVEVQKMG